MSGNNCPICNALLFAPTIATDARAVVHNCPRCGQYTITDEALAMLAGTIRQKPFRWAITSYAIRRLTGDNNIHNVTQKWLQSVWTHEVLPRPQEQADTFVQTLGGDDVAPAAWVPINPQRCTGILGTADDPHLQQTAGFQFVVEGLKTKNLIEQQKHPNADGTIGYRLSHLGWERFDELRKRSVESQIAFMAMGYGNADVDHAFSAFVDGIAKTGYQLRRLDQKPKAGLIDLRMRVEIRAAKFLVADLTDENRGAYWEAGFAEGLGKKVYYTCETSKFHTAKTHFDTEHLLTVRWSLSDIVRAVDELKSAVRNDFPAEAIQSDPP
jgi:hypothetical protein